MKTALIIILTFLTFAAFQVADSKSNLIGKWRLFALKKYSNNILTNKISDTYTSKTITFEKNGDFKEEADSLKLSGKWTFNNDQTKVGLIIDNYNGVIEVPNSYDSLYIIKLEHDTLVYRTIGHIINETLNNREYYFVKVK